MYRAFETPFGYWLVVWQDDYHLKPIDCGFPIMSQEDAMMQARLLNVGEHIYG